MPYVTAGDPDFEATAEIILALEKSGADLIELNASCPHGTHQMAHLPLPAHLDGNSVTLEPPLARFEVLPGALKVVVPQR